MVALEGTLAADRPKSELQVAGAAAALSDSLGVSLPRSWQPPSSSRVAGGVVVRRRVEVGGVAQPSRDVASVKRTRSGVLHHLRTDSTAKQAAPERDHHCQICSV